MLTPTMASSASAHPTGRLESMFLFFFPFFYITLYLSLFECFLTRRILVFNDNMISYCVSVSVTYVDEHMIISDYNFV